MEAINLKVKANSEELDQLKSTEIKYQQSIVNDSLLIQLVLIYFNTLTLILKNEIKSELIGNYLKTARLGFNKQLNLVKLQKLDLKLLEPKNNIEFKDTLEAESELVQSLVRNLNKVFVIQYDNYSWKTFNSFYYVNDESIKNINKKIESLLNQANKINENFSLIQSFSEQEKASKPKNEKCENLLALEEKDEFSIPLILAPNKIA